MPLVELVCYCPNCRGEQSLPVETTLDHAARRGNGKYPYELLRAMVNEVQDRGTRISTTTLTTKCLRSETLIRTTDYGNDPDRMYASFRGTMFHGRLEKTAHPQAIAEARFHKIIDGLGPFSGSPDLVDPKAGTLYDYKFSKENPRFDYPWKDHVVQNQINRWLVDNADWVEHAGHTYAMSEVGSMHLYGEYFGDDIAVSHQVSPREVKSRFRPIDWQGLYVVYMDDKGPKPLLITRSEQVPKRSGPGTKSARVADIWPDERVEELVRERYVVAQEALSGGVLPDITDDFKGWAHPLCDWCSVRDDCVSRYVAQQVSVQIRSAA